MWKMLASLELNNLMKCVFTGVVQRICDVEEEISIEEQKERR